MTDILYSKYDYVIINVRSFIFFSSEVLTKCKKFKFEINQCCLNETFCLQ